jgi:hypothetical protein
MNIAAPEKTGNVPPAELRNLPAWLVWRFEHVAGETKARKVPLYANGARRHGVQGRPEDRQQLVTFDVAHAAATSRGFDGVGFCPMPEFGVVALDFDNCIAGGILDPDVERVIAGTYAELSPSGRGVRAFVRGNLGNRKDHGAPFGFEVFSSKGFVTVTGQVLPITELTDAADTVAPAAAELLGLCAQRFGQAEAAEAGDTSGGIAPLGLTEQDLRGALAALDPSMGHDPWLKVGMALHHETSGEGFSLWDEWSAGGAQYPGTDALQVRWESFGRHSGRPTTANYLVQLANEQGAAIDLAALAVNDFEVIKPEPGEIAAAEEQKQRAALSFVDFASLLHTTPPPREWVVDQWIPRKSVTSMFGRGGHGKSLIAQQLAMCVSNGMSFLGNQALQGPVLGLFAEDDTDELLRRAAELYAAFGLDPGQGSESLHLDARAGKFNTLVSFSQDHMAKPTALMASIKAQCARLRPVLVILDNIAQLFAGQENARHEVTAFCNELTAIAREFNCAVLLLGHTAKIEDSEYSGSTAWDAAVRSRLLLARQEDGSTILRKVKANYSALDEQRIEYRAGAFVPLPSAREAGPEVIEAVKPLITGALALFTKRQQATSHLATARNYLIKLMMAETDLAGSVRVELLQATLRAMVDTGEILPGAALPWKNASRHAVTGLALA